MYSYSCFVTSFQIIFFFFLDNFNEKYLLIFVIIMNYILYKVRCIFFLICVLIKYFNVILKSCYYSLENNEYKNNNNLKQRIHQDTNSL